MQGHRGQYTIGFSGGSEVKASASNEGVLGLIPGLGRSPGKGNGNKLPVFGLLDSEGGRGWDDLGEWHSNMYTIM